MDHPAIINHTQDHYGPAGIPTETENISLQFSMDYEDYDQYTLPNEVQVGLFFLYGVNIFISVAGNFLVIFVFTYGRKSRTELAPYLINLAVSDLVMAVFCMPFTSTTVLLGKWIYPHFLCPAVSFMQYASVSSSIYTQTFISIDRLRSICLPFRSVTKTAKELIIILGFIWFGSLLFASIQFFIIKVQVIHHPPENGSDAVTYVCLETWPVGPNGTSNWQKIYSKIYTVCVFSVDYVVPLLCIGCAYSYVGVKLWERTTPGEASDARDKFQLQSKRKVIKMLALMVLSFGILWLPLHTFFLLNDFSSVVTDLPPKYYLTLFVTCHYFAMLSVIVNIWNGLLFIQHVTGKPWNGKQTEARFCAICVIICGWIITLLEFILCTSTLLTTSPNQQVIYVLVNKNFKSDLRHLVDRNCWKRLPHSEAHRQAVALRRAPAYHHYHRRHIQLGPLSKEIFHSSPMNPCKRSVGTPYDAHFRNSKNPSYSDASSGFQSTEKNGIIFAPRSAPPVLNPPAPNIANGKKQFLDYYSFSDV